MQIQPFLPVRTRTAHTHSAAPSPPCAAPAWMGREPAPTVPAAVAAHGKASALGPMEAVPYSLPYTGRGVGIAILDTGIAPHADLGNRLVAFQDMVDGGQVPCDPVGHGTHVAGDAAGSGAASRGRFAGAAPQADIIGIRVLGGGLEGEDVDQAVAGIVSGLHWMVENKDRYNIRVANLSLGIPSDAGGGLLSRLGLGFDPLREAVDEAVRAGIVVVAAAGNEGERGRGSLDTAPATNPNVITVGALDSRGTLRQDDDVVADFSSRGPAPDGSRKPDIIAPGAHIMSLNATGSEIEIANKEQADERRRLSRLSDDEIVEEVTLTVLLGALGPEILSGTVDEMRAALIELMRPEEIAVPVADTSRYIAMDGTSMAAPIVAGICANMIEANPSLSPQQVKDILMQTARPLPGFDRCAQGAGMVDPQAAVARAEQMRAFPHEVRTVAASRA